MINAYAKAYTEVLEILSYFSEEEYSKIPKEKLDFYRRNMDKEYIYIYIILIHQRNYLNSTFLKKQMQF